MSIHMVNILPLLLIIGHYFCQSTHIEAGRDDFYQDVFPDNFLWGYGSSAYQVEGGYNEGGKGPSTWDHVTHIKPSVILDKSTGDVAADSYHRYREDVVALKKSGVKVYRFSTAWTRILPKGDSSIISRAGLAYYNDLIDELVENNIQPVVTLFHLDPPLNLEIQGGWLNETTVFHFAEYARIMFKNFGDRVKIWTTFNEASVFCHGTEFGEGTTLPLGVKRTPASPYRCAHNVLKAHGLTYRIYEKEFKRSQNGRIGFNVLAAWYEPRDPTNEEDVAASSRALQFQVGWMIQPLLKGVYPPVMRRLLDEKSKAEGRRKSLLPTFSSKWAKIITGTLDYIGLNHYDTFYAYTSEQGNLYSPDSKTGISPDPLLLAGFVAPWGFRKILNWVGDEYNLEIFVQENGHGENVTVGIHNPRTVDFFRLFINEMLKAVKIDGIKVIGYTAWSLTDNFEFLRGYTIRFGSFSIDFTDEGRRRVPKDSAKFLRKVFRHNGFPATLSRNGWTQGNSVCD